MGGSSSRLATFGLVSLGVVIGMGIALGLFSRPDGGGGSGVVTPAVRQAHGPEQGRRAARAAEAPQGTGRATEGKGRAPKGAPTETSATFRTAIERAAPAVVLIASVTRQGGATGFFPPRERRGLGSGVIVDAKEGLILTNSHVVRGAGRIQVQTRDGRTFDAKIVGTDPKAEIGVIRITADKLTAATLGDAEELQVGDWVLAIGTPFGLAQTVTAGIVSAKGRSGVGVALYEKFIQTDAAINPGNSGGPLINIRGEVVGINTAIASRSGGHQGIGFAIPIGMAREIMDQLVKHGSIVRGWLGVATSDLAPAGLRKLGLEDGGGVLVAATVRGSPAARAGIRSGDVIVMLNGNPPGSVDDLRYAVAKIAVGKKVPIVVLRGRKRVKLTATIGEQPPLSGR